MNRRVKHSAALLPVAALLTLFIASGCEMTRTPEAEAFRVTLDSREASAPTTDIDPQSGTAYYSWFGKDDNGRSAVFLSTLSATDSTPAAPVRVNPADVSVNPHSQAPAQVATGRSDDLVFVAWSTRQEIEGRRFPASDVVLARSEDGGRTFAPPVIVNDDADGPPAGHTFHDLAVASDGTVYVSWLDSRDTDRASAGDASVSAAVDPHEHHDHALAESTPPPTDRARSGHTRNDHHRDGALSDTDVRIARSTDGGQTFSESVVVARGSCQCCRTALFVGDDNIVYLAWRHIYDDNVRDIAFASSADGGRTFSTPARVHADGWQIEGCPHSGPSLAVEADGTIHLSWYTAAPGAAGLRYATSTDGGRRFSAPQSIESDVPLAIAHVAGGGRAPVWVAWEDPLVNQICAAPAGTSPKASDQKLTFAGTMPAIATADGIRTVAWQNEGGIEAFVERRRAAGAQPGARGLTTQR